MNRYHKRILQCLLLSLSCTCFFGCGKSAVIFDDTVKNVGIYLNDPSEIEKFEEKPDILGWFERWGAPLAKNKAQLCIREQITPLITWEPYDHTLTDIGSGKYDERIRDYLTKLHELFGESTVLIRLAHEMEVYSKDSTPWYPWQYYGGEQDYIRMWRHVVGIGHEAAPNVRWIWSPNRINETSANWYPGDPYVDYVGITLNHEADHKTTFTTFGEYYSREGRAQYFDLFDKKVLLSEIGYAERDEKAKGAYLESVFDQAEKDDKICGIVFFNYNINNNRQYKFSDNEYYMNIWYDGIRRLHQNAKQTEEPLSQEGEQDE